MDENTRKIDVNQILLTEVDIDFLKPAFTVNEMSRVLIQEETEQVKGIFSVTSQ